MKKIVKALVLLLSFLMITMTTTINNVNAQNNRVIDVGTVVDDTIAKRLTLTTTTVISNVPSSESAPEEMVVGKSYTAKYPSELNYFGIPLTVEVEAKLISTNKDPNDGTILIQLTEAGLIGVNWYHAYNTDIKWTINITDAEGNPFTEADILVGYRDPDESNYMFNTSGKDIYFIDKTFKEGKENPDYPSTAASAYVVESNGLMLTDANGTKCNPTSADASFVAPDYDSALFLVSMSKKSTFTFDSVTFGGGGMSFPIFYSLKGKWKVSYILNDSEAYPADNSGNVDPEAPTDPTKSFIEYESGVGFEKEIEDPTREGYTFLGWTRKDVTDPKSASNSKVQKWDFGDKVFEAQWEALPKDYIVEYYYMDDQGEYPTEATESVTREGKIDQKVAVTEDDKVPTKDDYVLDESEKANPVYEEVITVDGDTILKVYFKKSLTVTYKPGTQGTFAEQVNPELDYGVDTPEFKGTPEGNEGYDFVGWDKEIADTVTENAVYVAQWEPWKYYIKYDANGGQGDMPTQTFVYSDDEMDSKKNQFTRDGYEFLGFEYEHKGTKYIITSTKDFNDMLKDLGPGSKVTLIAQWKKLPDPVVKYYALPVTGVEDRR